MDWLRIQATRLTFGVFVIVAAFAGLHWWATTSTTQDIPLAGTPYKIPPDQPSCNNDDLKQTANTSVGLRIVAVHKTTDGMGNVSYDAYLEIYERSPGSLHQSVLGIGTFWQNINWHTGEPLSVPTDKAPGVIENYNNVPPRMAKVGLPDQVGNSKVIVVEADPRDTPHGVVVCGVIFTRIAAPSNQSGV